MALVVSVLLHALPSPFCYISILPLLPVPYVVHIVTHIAAFIASFLLSLVI